MLHITSGLTAYILIVTALLGLVMGSFLNCWAYRLACGESIAKGRSHCTSCGHVLKVGDLIPVLSFLALGGKCRYCGEKVSSRYWVAELLCAAYYVSVVWHFDVTPDAAKYLILGSALFCLALVDLEKLMIPDRLILIAIANFVFFTCLYAEAVSGALISGFLGGLSISVPLLLFVLLMDRVLGRESMGGGDIKLLFAIGLYFSWKLNLLLLVAACIIGIVFGLFLRGKESDPDNPGAFPFGPAIIAAYWGVLIFGDSAVNWYIKLF